MERIFSLFLIVVTLFLAQPVNAHLSNQTPFFKINGVFTPLYSVSPDYNTNVSLPQDAGPENYLINQELTFELDQNNLPVSPAILDTVIFEWDLGDGTKAQGLKVTHQYNKQGSYLISVNAVYGGESPQLIQSTLINVLSDSSYKLPQAIIKVNGKEVVNDPTKLVKVLLSESTELDGTFSQASSKIVSYSWDLDSSQLPEGGVVKTIYNNSFSRVYPALKITDENGFISYAIVGLERADQNFFTALWFKISDWANGNQQTIELALVTAPLLFITPIVGLIGFDWLKRKRQIKK